MKDTIKKLETQSKELTEKLNLVNKAIKSLQAVCPHKNEHGKTTMEWVASGHNKDHYVCSLCNMEDSW